MLLALQSALGVKDITGTAYRPRREDGGRRRPGVGRSNQAAYGPSIVELPICGPPRRVDISSHIKWIATCVSLSHSTPETGPYQGSLQYWDKDMPWGSTHQ